jgi:PAS domain S-box-containing protein
MVEGINAGADDYIPKSSDFEVLKARLRAQLRRKQFEDENRTIRERLLQKEIEAARAKAAQEIAEARASFEPLLRNEAWLNSVVRIAHLGAWDWDLLKNTQSWSDEQFRIFGLEPGTAEPSYDGFLHALNLEDRQRVAEIVQQALTNQPRFQVDCRLVWPNGDLRHAVCQGEICRDEVGKPVRIIGTVLDITPRKQAEEEVSKLNEQLEQRVAARTEELRAVNKELEAFNYAVAHDLRGPLRHIHGFAEILAEQAGPVLDDASKKHLQAIQKGAQHMAHLLEDLLSLARLGRQELSKQDCGLSALVKEVVATLQPEIKDREVKWRIAELPFVDCDPTLMKQVLFNLLANALKFTQTRERAIIEVGQTTLDGEPVFFVRDNGVGFNMKFAEKLFGLFQRLHRQEDFEGTGVGLAIVQRIIQRHGGRVRAEAELNKGATFYFTLCNRESEKKEQIAAHTTVG